MKMGYAEVDITPQVGEEMSGYGLYLNRRARGVLDPLRARAVAWEMGSTRAALVQMDLIGIDKTFAASVRAEVGRRVGVPGEGLLLHCIHTHSGPASFPYRGCGHLCEDYVIQLRHKIIRLVQDSFERLGEVKRSGRFEEAFCGIGHTRAGHAQPDPTVRGALFDVAGVGRICLCSYACHPVVLGRNDLFSADYPGRVVQELNAYGVKAIYLNGPCGDIDPLSNAHRWGAGTDQTLNIYGRDLAEVLRRGMDRALAWSPSKLSVASRFCEIAGQIPSHSELDALLSESKSALEHAPEDASARLNAEWSQLALDRLASGALTDPMTAEIQVLNLGDVAVVGLAGEVFTDLGKAIRRAFPAHLLLVAATTNGLLGYITTKADIEDRGYASSLACRIYDMVVPQPGEGERFAEQAIEVIRTTM